MGDVNWSKPPSVIPERYEIVPDLDIMDFMTTGFFGGLTVSEKKREKLIRKMATEMDKNGEPYILNGVRHG